MVALGDLVEFKGGGTPSKSIDAYWGGDIPWASVKDFKSTEISKTVDSITIEGLKNSASNLIPSGNLIVPTRMALGKVAINTVDIAINQDLRALIVKDDKTLDKRYLLRFLESKAKFLESEGKGATVKGITQDVLRNLDVPLPPLPEQKRIAAILDKAASLRRKNQQASQLADQFLRAVFLDLFGDPVTNPKGWSVNPLKEQILYANNGLSRRRKETENEGHIVLRLQDVQYDGIQFKKELNRIKLDDKEALRYKVDVDDILFIRVNGNPDYVGRSAVFKGHIEPVYHNDHLIRIKVGDAYNAEFLSYCLNFKGSRKIISTQIKTSAGQYTISQDGIERLEFFRPPIELQNKFITLKNHTLKVPHHKIDDGLLFNALSQKAFAGKL